jgi:hypothetical protein
MQSERSADIKPESAQAAFPAWKSGVIALGVWLLALAVLSLLLLLAGCTRPAVPLPRPVTAGLNHRLDTTTRYLGDAKAVTADAAPRLHAASSASARVDAKMVVVLEWLRQRREEGAR